MSDWPLSPRLPHRVFTAECCFSIVDGLSPLIFGFAFGERGRHQRNFVACYGISLSEIGVFFGLHPPYETCGNRRRRTEQVCVDTPADTKQSESNGYKLYDRDSRTQLPVPRFIVCCLG